MNDSCSYILGAVRRYVLDYASDGYSASGAKAFARLLGGELPPPLAALFDTLECTAAERMAAVLGLAAAVDAQTAAALRAQFGTPDGVLTPQILCALILGTSYPADGGLGLIGGVTARIFDGVSPACGARMTLKPLIRDFLLYGTAGEGWLTRLSPEGEAPDDYAASAADAAAEAMSACGGDIPSVIHIIGVPGSGRRTVLRAAAARRGLHFALIRPCAAASADPAGLAVLLALMGTWPAIPADGMTGDADFRTLLHALLAEIGTVAVLSEEAMSADTADADYIAVPVPLPSVAAQSAIWQRKSAAYPVADGVDFREIAMEFRLPPGAIDRAFRFAAMQSRGAALTAADIKRGCYITFGSFLCGRSVRVSCAFSWDFLVLPAHSK